MDEPHEHHDHDHGPGGSAPVKPEPVLAEDAGSRALNEALKSSFVIVKFVMVVLVALFLASGMFTVESNLNAIVLRFGQPVGDPDVQLYGPGWHWAWPYPIDEVVYVPVNQLHSVSSTAGWYAVTLAQERSGTEPPAGASLPPADGYTLTGDGNIIHVRAIVRYRIRDAKAFEFSFSNTSNLVENAVNNALHYASVRFSADQATRLDIARFRDAVMNRVAELVDTERLGVSLELQNSAVQAIPPRQVKDAFNAVLEAEVDKKRTISEAEGKFNEVTSRAKGEAEAIKSGAKADATRLVQTAQADAEYFKSRLPEYTANPRLFTERRIVETMLRVLTNAQEKFVVSDPDGLSRQLRLMLNREPAKPATNAPAGP
jgi:membrane protease subunit HflK